MASSVSQHQPLLRDAATARRILRQMALIRRFEERTEEQYTRARIGGYCHLAIGEEAANVGAIEPLGESDYLFTSYRDHGAALAVGSDPAGVMAEMERAYTAGHAVIRRDRDAKVLTVLEARLQLQESGNLR